MVITVPADILAPNAARPSADTLLIEKVDVFPSSLKKSRCECHKYGIFVVLRSSCQSAIPSLSFTVMRLSAKEAEDPVQPLK